MGDDLIYGSQAGDHLAGGSGDDEIHGNRGVSTSSTATPASTSTSSTGR